MVSVLVAEHFGTPLTDGQKERLYAEGVQWYRLYGVSHRPVPADWASFCIYWDHMCAEVPEDTPAARAVLDVSHIAKPPVIGAVVPDPVWALVRVPLARSAVWVTVGLYPPAVRERLGYR